MSDSHPEETARDTVWNNPDFVAQWNNTYGIDMRHAKARVDLLFPLVAERVGAFDDLSLIDLGCGNGNLIHNFLDYNFSRWTGIDQGGAVLDSARDAITDSRVNFINGDVTAPIASESGLTESADIVTSFFVLEEIPLENLTGHFEQMRSLLKDNGKGIIFFNHPAYALIHNLESRQNGADNKKFPGHEGYFDRTPTKFSLGKLNGEQGYEVHAEYHHKTMADVFNALTKAGLTVDYVLEPPKSDVNWPPQNTESTSGDYPRFLYLEVSPISP